LFNKEEIPLKTLQELCDTFQCEKDFITDEIKLLKAKGFNSSQFNELSNFGYEFE
jgi:hypothetical protein